MKTHRFQFLAIPLLVFVFACSKGADTTLADEDTAQMGTVTPQASLPPAPTAAPVTTNTIPTTPTGQFQSVPQNSQYSQFNGWPYYNYNSQSSSWQQGYPNGYQTYNYNQYPNYFQHYQRPYYFAAVVELYRRFLGRNPDEPGAHFFIREAMAGRPRSNILDAFVQSQEAQLLGNSTHVQNAIGLFRVATGQLPTRSALSYWVNQLSTGITLATLSGQFNPGGRYTRSVTDAFKSILNRFANYAEYDTHLTAIRNGSKAYVDFITELRNSAEANTLGKVIAENCIFIHRIITGYLPASAELAACVAKGDNTQLNSGNYNTILQQYAQDLMNRYSQQYPYY